MAAKSQARNLKQGFLLLTSAGLMIILLFDFNLVWQCPNALAAGHKASTKPALVPNSNMLLRDGIRLYGEKQYKAAINRFEEVVRARGQDATASYYIALCSVALHDDNRAAVAYRLAITSARDPQIRELAQKGLKGLELKSAKKGADPSNRQSLASKATASSPAKKADVSEEALASEQPGKSSAGATSGGPETKVKKIVEFYATWCSNCKEFAPTFDKARRKYGGTIMFERLDGDNPANSNLKTKCDVSGYPTLVYFDANGKIVHIDSGAPTEEEFFNFIEKNK